MSFVGTDRFKVIRLLGSGSMGMVYLVFDRQLGAEVALKLLDAWDGMDLYRFKSEFRSLADLKHPNLATLHELICEVPLWYFTMEYVAGVPFDTYLLGPRPPNVARCRQGLESATGLRRPDSARRGSARNPMASACAWPCSSSAPGCTPCTGPAASTAISSRRTCW
jgi:serine/threonine protein kinase